MTEWKQNVVWLPCKQLSVVWADAQRPFDEAHAKKIADNFDPDLVESLAVTKPNGEGVYHLVDGQHRKWAIETWGGPDQRAPCIILNASDPARAAQLFVKRNNDRKRITPLVTFKASVTAGNPEVVDINRIVRAAGFRVGDSGINKAISSVGALMSIYKRFGAEVLADTLETIKATWGLEDNNAVVAPILRGYAAFLVEHRHSVNRKRLHETISKYFTPGKFVAIVKARKETNGGNLEESAKDAIVMRYNKGAPATKKLKARGVGQ